MCAQQVVSSSNVLARLAFKSHSPSAAGTSPSRGASPLLLLLASTAPPPDSLPPPLSADMPTPLGAPGVCAEPAAWRRREWWHSMRTVRQRPFDTACST